MVKINTSFLSLALIIVLISIVHACDRGPTAEFSFIPADNPEAGEEISFINESIDATTYQWNFGNDKTSDDDSPTTVFDKRGNFTVSLHAFNEAGSDSVSKIIQINDPTIMVFFVFLPDSVTPLADCNVWVYDNEEDWDDFTDPQFNKFTDADGFAEFLNLESIPYYIIMFKETDEGIYITGGYTEALEQNEPNVYEVVAEFLTNEDLESAKKGRTLHTFPLMALPLKKLTVP